MSSWKLLKFLKLTSLTISLQMSLPRNFQMDAVCVLVMNALMKTLWYLLVCAQEAWNTFILNVSKNGTRTRSSSKTQNSTPVLLGKISHVNFAKLLFLRFLKYMIDQRLMKSKDLFVRSISSTSQNQRKEFLMSS